MLVDLSKVTRALVALLREAIPSSSGSGSAPVSALPPDLLPAGSLGVYLFHVTESAHFKNQVAPGADSPPVRFTPMGLSLYYQITALGLDETENGTYFEQDMIGYAAKALHDYPVIDDATAIGSNPPILKTAGLDQDDNKLRLALQPMPYDEATNYWSAGSTSPRLALYYEVSVVLLRPPKPSTITGRVLSFGVDSFVRGAPFLDGSENVIAIAPPGRPPNKVTVRPAQAPIGPSAGGAASAISFTGYNLAGDAGTTVLLRGGSLTGTVEVDPNWGVAATSSSVRISVRATIGGQAVLPGVYTAVVRTLSRTAGGLIGVSSNETPFSITPRIDGAAVAAGVVTLAGFPFQHPLITPEDLGVYVGGVRYVPSASAAPAAGTYWIASATQMTIGPAAIAAGPLPLRVNVLGTQSPPFWIQV